MYVEDTVDVVSVVSVVIATPSNVERIDCYHRCPRDNQQTHWIMIIVTFLFEQMYFLFYMCRRERMGRMGRIGGMATIA